MRYTTAFPYFPQQEIELILNETQAMLNGEKMLSMGDSVKQFEEEFAKYCGRPYGIATNSCTSALNVILRSLYLSPQDEVIVPTQTFFANLSSIINSNAKPIFCDTDENFLIDLESLKQKITKNTKAIVVVHFCGAISSNIFEIKELCKKHNIHLIEDCSHAHGAYITDTKGNIHKAGSIGDIACFSFFSTKIMTMGEGGIILCNDKEQALILRSLANRGLNALSKTEEFITYGENFRLPEFNAILGLSQLKCLESFIEHRNKIAQIYKDNLGDLNHTLRFQEVEKNIRHSYWRFLIFLKHHDPKQIISLLAEHGIAADAPYNPLLHQHKIYNDTSNCPLAEMLSKTHISLPMHMKITLKDAEEIAKILKKILLEV